MKIIGLCGQSGAGKTTALEIFENNGFAVVDCDEVSRFVTVPHSPCIVELVEAFGDRILNSDGTLRRREVAEISFSDPEKLQTLNRITHKYILAEVFGRIDKFRAQDFSAVVIDAPVLFESGLDKSCDMTLAICAPLDVRLERIMERDKISKQSAQARISRQLSEKELSHLADRVIMNDGTLEEFRNKIIKYVKEIGDSLD